MRKKNKKILNKQKKKRIIIITSIILILIISINYIFFINNILSKPTGKENITTKLVNETDFLNWFIDFDNLYNEKIKSPKYTLTKDVFEQVNTFLNNQNKTNIYFKDNIYHIDEFTTIELDINTKSFRYTKYNNDEKAEILEVNLINGKYYVQLINKEYIYKIKFNKDIVKNKRNKYKEKEVTINNTIFGTNNFDW